MNLHVIVIVLCVAMVTQHVLYILNHRTLNDLEKKIVGAQEVLNLHQTNQGSLSYRLKKLEHQAESAFVQKPVMAKAAERSKTKKPVKVIKTQTKK